MGTYGAMTRWLSCGALRPGSASDPPPSHRPRPVLRGRGFLRRSVGRRGSSGRYPRARRPRGLGLPRLSHLRRRRRHPSATARPRRPHPSRRIPRGHGRQRRPRLAPPGRAHPRLRRRCAWSMAGRCGSCPATTRPSPIPPATPWEPVPLPHLRHRVHLRPAGLPLAARTAAVFDDIHAWWRANQDAGRATTLLFGYALGKAQRLIAGLDPPVGPILTHGAVERLNAIYRAGGVALPPTTHAAVSDRARLAAAPS